jgi:hydroxymethylpyrimidine/phosphomethylpyrimidine kinase
MPTQMITTPVVMSISSHDPCGGAGISADIETLTSLGCHCTPIITKLSARDTTANKDSHVTDSSLLVEQIRAVLEDMTIDLFKIGDIASIANAEAVHTILNDYPDITVVLDPDMSSPDQTPALTEAIKDLLFTQANVVVASEHDAYRLAPGADTLAASAHELLEYGFETLMITGTHGSSSHVRNQLYTRRGLIQQYDWERLPNSFQGAGSTLSAAISAYLSHKLSLAESVQQAQKFTWNALANGRRIGMGQLLPDRLHWCRK